MLEIPLVKILTGLRKARLFLNLPNVVLNAYDGVLRGTRRALVDVAETYRQIKRDHNGLRDAWREFIATLRNSADRRRVTDRRGLRLAVVVQADERRGMLRRSTDRTGSYSC